MARTDLTHRLGWLGTGRMGSALALRLLAAGCDLTVYNRTKAKAEPLAARGASMADTAAGLGAADIVFVTVGGSDDLIDVLFGPRGVITAPSVNLDFHPTFTASLLRKDFDLGLAAAQECEVPLPVAATVHQIVHSLVGRGHGAEDFAALLQMQADSAGVSLVSENVKVSDGLAPDHTDGRPGILGGPGGAHPDAGGSA